MSEEDGEDVSSLARVAETGASAGMLVPLMPLIVDLSTYHNVREAFVSLCHGDEERAVTWLSKIDNAADVRLMYGILGDLMGKVLAVGSIMEAEKLLGAMAETVGDKEQNGQVVSG